MVFAGIRVALGNSWSTLVAAEMLAASAGLGYMIQIGRTVARPDIVIEMCIRDRMIPPDIFDSCKVKPGMGVFSS